ncbi:hypothetical protein Atai01_51210 [Amycolatopsis taiwanensis]|uniref:Uncharacterized protein n=1 Tax=Amycolatopsis taiwanensis TaxID=342230 RepID=A0A9W6R6L5_9PSEU|nr:hypothetical protein Atai01_51210 [Amycolatopsis taiwanensis]
MSAFDIRTAASVPRAELLRFAGAVENASEHAVARAIADLAIAETGRPADVEDFRALSGLGARGRVAGRDVLIGSVRLLAAEGMNVPPELAAVRAEWEHVGRTSVLVAVDGAVRGMIAVADTVRPSAAAAVAELHELGLRTVLLTGTTPPRGPSPRRSASARSSPK